MRLRTPEQEVMRRFAVLPSYIGCWTVGYIAVGALFMGRRGMHILRQLDTALETTLTSGDGKKLAASVVVTSYFNHAVLGNKLFKPEDEP